MCQTAAIKVIFSVNDNRVLKNKGFIVNKAPNKQFNQGTVICDQAL